MRKCDNCDAEHNRDSCYCCEGCARLDMENQC